MLRWIAIAVVAFAAGLAAGRLPALQGPLSLLSEHWQDGVFVCKNGHPDVENGDTIDCDGYRVQLADFDAAETVAVKKCELEQAQRSTDALMGLIASSASLSIQLLTPKSRKRDARGILLIDGASVAARMVSEGGACWRRVSDWCQPDPCTIGE